MGTATLIPDFQLSKSLGSITLSGSTAPSSITIVGADIVSGSFKATKYSIKYFPISSSDRSVDWSITSGGQYASVNSDGELTIFPEASSSSVTLKAALHSDPTVFSTKEITVSFPALPAEYQAVEYLQGDGNAYIDLGFKAHLTSDGMMLKCQVAEGSLFFTGARGGNTARFFFANAGSKSAVGYARCSVYTKEFYASTKNCNDGLPHVFEFDGQARKFLFDGEMLEDEFPSSNMQSGDNMWLFGTVLNGAIAMKIYSFMHFRYDEVYANCVPCYRKVDNVPGVYDLVSGTFFTNAGSGAFSLPE